jgi:phage shock protein C
MNQEPTVEIPIAETTTQAGNHSETTQTETQTQPVPAPRVALFRHPSQKIIGGVCGGLADYLGWDPSLVRILWVVATVTTGGGGFLAYLALWLLLPVGTVAGGQMYPAAIELNERSLGLAAKVLIGLGLVWLLANLGILPSLWSTFWQVMAVVFWPALLISIGYLLLRGAGGTGDWRANLSGWGQRFRTNLKTPQYNSDEVKSKMRSLRQQLPLKRSRRDRLFMGVCGGIGQKIGIDANLVRLLWVAFSIGSVGMGVLVYVLCGLLLPEETPLEVNPYVEPQDVQVIDGTATYKV